jgi:hypothetical protein
MNGLAALLALALAQEPQPPPAAPPERAAPEQAGTAAPEPAQPPPPDAPRPPPPAPRPAPPPEAASGPAAREVPAAAPRKAPAATPTAGQTAPAPTLAPPPTAIRPPPPTPAPSPAATSTGSPPAFPAPAAGPAPGERAQVAAAAARFFEALLARRAGDLAAQSSPGFSFDGRAARGAEEVRGRWSEAVARHDGATHALLDLELLPAAEASARFGKPPRRIAALLQPGSWVAVANLSGRPTFVFFARQGGSWVATGLHD